VSSPYLPTERNIFLEKLERGRFRITYNIWKRMIKRHLGDGANYDSHLRMADVGCGPGNYLCCLEAWFPKSEIFGIDPTEELLAYASKRTKRARYLLNSAENISMHSESVDVISVFQVVEHLQKPEAFFCEAARLLKLNGLLLLSTPNPGGIAAKILGTGWQGIRPDHISMKYPSEWHAMLRKNKFVILDEGTTLFNGLPLIGRFPFGLPFQLAQATFGWFSWNKGESYMAVARKS